MIYWKIVARATLIFLALGMLWQGVLLWRAVRVIESQRATGFVIVGHGLMEFFLSVLIAEWITGSLWYLLRGRQ